MKTKTIYHLDQDCNVQRIEVVVKTKKSPVNKTEHSANSVSLSPEKLCEIYNDIAERLGWRFIDPSHKIFNS